VAVDASGVMRVSNMAKSKTGQLSFADLFMAVPLGANPVTNTPGYPLCRFIILMAELKATFEVTAGLSYSNDILFVVPSGFKFEYDTTRPIFNPNGDPLDKNNGRVTKIYQLKPASFAVGNFDGDYDLIFDASGSGSGWIGVSPTAPVIAATNLYIAEFATFAGIHLRDACNPGSAGGCTPGSPVANNDPVNTIIQRARDGSEIKEWEAVGEWMRALAAGNSGKLPPKYKLGDASSPVPRRATCVGAHASNGFCAQ
jgi:hypothetical protein